MSCSQELRRQVEDLAVQLVMDSAAEPSACQAHLSGILERARTENAAPVAQAAQAMLQLLEGPAARPDSDLQEAMALLQQAAEDLPAQPATRPPTLAQDPELLGDFIVESREHLASIESQALTLERDPRDSEALHSVFRGFHTIKGLAGFLELWDMQQLAHEVEALLDRARNGEMTLSPAAIEAILQSADGLRRWLSHLEEGLRGQHSDPPEPVDRLIAAVREVKEAGGNPIELAALAAAVSAAPDASLAPATTPAAPPTASMASESMAVRVDTGKLDALVDMAGELVIAETLVRHDPELGQIKSQTLQRKMAQLKRITAELQKTAMAMRLVPVGPLFRRMARLVRDLSRQCGKQVTLESAGGEIELDRTIVEQLADPLMHMVRNAIDHGIEPPAERERSGKSAGATVRLRAAHQAGQVVIEISDDGRGLNRSRIRSKAEERGIITPGAELSDAEICNLIFEPGFSTAAEVTSVSGRGVGMDVVRKHVERLRGRIELRSAEGQGTSFFLKLPLTLAIIDGLAVAVGRERYIVPLFAVREMFRPGEDCIWTVQNRSEMALVRGSLLPVVRLYRRFGVTPRSEDPRESVLIVAESGDQRFCLLVDELIGKQEVVIKSLGEMFHNKPGIAGGAILGDGRVGLILDIERLFKEGSVESVR